MQAGLALVDHLNSAHGAVGAPGEWTSIWIPQNTCKITHMEAIIRLLDVVPTSLDGVFVVHVMSALGP